MAETKRVQERVQDIAAEAEDVILALQERDHGRLNLTTNQIRKFLAAVNALTNKITVHRARSGANAALSDSLAAEVRYLKVKLAYQSAKDSRGNVKAFAEKAQLKSRIDGIGTDMKKYEEFAHFMEALVAYHKFHGGRD